MGIFSGVTDAQVSKSGPYFTPGTYTVSINAVKIQKSQKNANKSFFIIETEIVDSDNDTLRSGMTASQVINMASDMWLVNVKAFVCAAMGVDSQNPLANEQVCEQWATLNDGETTDFEGVCDRIVSDDNPLHGVQIDLVAREVTTRAGNPFTVHDWQPVDWTE